MNSLRIYFKYLFADDEKLVREWKQFSGGNGTAKYSQAIAKELEKRNYQYDDGKWIKPEVKAA